MIYTFYGRVSTDSDEQSSALDNQEQYWLETFKQKGFQLNNKCGVYYSREGVIESRQGYYIDEGITGYKTRKYRKAFMKMLSDAKRGMFDMIYTRSISRFGRNVVDIVNTIDELKKINVGVYFEDIDANTLNDKDKFKIHIFTGLAEEESRLKSFSVQKGKRIAAENGVWSGREPYGYNIFTGEMEIDGVKTYVKGRLVVNQDEAIIVKEIFNLYLVHGWGLSKIAKHLNEKQVPRKRNSKKWDQSIISKMLANPVYKGTYWMNRTYKKDPQNNIVAAVPEDEQFIKFDHSLQIIDEEIFKKVQKVKEERSKLFGDFKYKATESIDELGNKQKKKVRIGIDNKTGRYSGAHLFSNLLRCGNCDSPLRFKRQKSTSGRIHKYWFCSNNDKTGNCEYRNLQRDEEVLEWVKEEITSFQNSEFRQKNILKRILKLEFDTSDNSNKIEQLEQQLSDIKNKSDKNFEVFEKGYILEEEYAERSSKLTLEMTEIKSKVNNLKNAEQLKQELIDQFNDYILEFQKIDIDNLTNASLRKIIDKIVFTTNDPYLDTPLNRMYVDLPEPKEIHWKFMGQLLEDINGDYVEKYFYADDYEVVDPITLNTVNRRV